MGDHRKRDGSQQGLLALVLALLLLPLAGCTTGGPPPAAAPVDLLTLRPYQAPPPDGLEQDGRLDWNFHDGIPAGWRAGPPGVKVIQEEDGVRLEHPDQRPWLELRCADDLRLPAAGIDPLRYDRINIGIRPLGAAEAALYYSFTDPGRYELNLRSHVRYKNKDRRVFGFAFPGVDGFETGIRLLRFYPALVRASAVVRRAVLVPRGSDYIAGSVLSRGWISLGQQYRRCWRLVGPGTREAELRLPAGPAELRWAVGSLVGTVPAELAVELETARGIRHRLAGGEAPPPGGGWQEQQADLSRWAGEQVTLRFRVDGGGPGTVTLIGSPAVLPAVDRDPAARPPNVLVVLVDTLRADRLSVYGAGRLNSPNLDRLARRGVVFTNAVAPSSWTLPSVAALLTGRYPNELKVGARQGAGLTRGIPTMAGGFARAGYDTAAFSANFIVDPFQGYARGFDAFYLAPVKQYTMPAAVLNQRVLAWMACRSERPFFCYLQYMDPHSPYSPPGSDRSQPSNAGTFQPGKPDGYRNGSIHPLTIGHEELESVDHAAMVARFYEEEVRYVDLQIGRLLAGLTRLGLLENTVVAVVADHGEEFYEHGFWSHGYTLYQDQLHVPMIVRLPRALAGRNEEAVTGQRVHTPVSLVDLLPTLFRLAGVEPARMPDAGRDLFAVPAERNLLSETWAGGAPPRFCLRQGPYKYVQFNREAESAAKLQYAGRWLLEHGPADEELYNLDDDPGERHNLVAELPDVARRMRQEVSRLFGTAATVVAGSGKQEKVDRDTEERLRELGYIE